MKIITTTLLNVNITITTVIITTITATTTIIIITIIITTIITIIITITTTAIIITTIITTIITIIITIIITTINPTGLISYSSAWLKSSRFTMILLAASGSISKLLLIYNKHSSSLLRIMLIKSIF